MNKVHMVLLVYLAILSFCDVKERQVSVLWLAAGALLLPGIGVIQCIRGILYWQELIAGAIPGVILLLAAGVTKKAGYADGVVLLELGVCMGCRTGFLLLCISLFLLALTSVFLLLLRKVRRNTKLPYIPFLLAAVITLFLSEGVRA